MASNFDNEEEAVVPLGQLRPSREAFGPVPSGKAKPAPRSKNAPRRPSAKGDGNESKRQGSRQALPAGDSSQRTAKQVRPAQARSQEPRPAQARPAQARPAQGRTAQTAAKRPAGKQVAVRSDRPQKRSGSNLPAKSRNLPARDEQFANRLAAADRSPFVNKPSSGWRSVLLKASGGVVNLGLSSEEKKELENRHQARRPVTDGTIAVFSRKGGVGKTTISAYLGTTLAVERGGRIMALDGDAEAGSLGWLLAPDAPSTLAALASADPIPNDYAGLRHYTTTTPEGLEVIVGDPAEMGPISNIGLEAVSKQLARHYDLSIFDTGAGVTRATGRVLVNSARVLLLVMGPSVDSVRAAERTLAWLDERPGEAADPNVQVIAVINGIPTNAKASHVDRIESHFANRCAAVVRIPWDAHLASGSSTVSLERLAKPTRQAFLELAATTVGTLARASRRPAASIGARRAS